MRFRSTGNRWKPKGPNESSGYPIYVEVNQDSLGHGDSPWLTTIYVVQRKLLGNQDPTSYASQPQTNHQPHRTSPQHHKERKKETANTGGSIVFPNRGIFTASNRLKSTPASQIHAFQTAPNRAAYETLIQAPGTNKIKTCPSHHVNFHDPRVRCTRQEHPRSVPRGPTVIPPFQDLDPDAAAVFGPAAEFITRVSR